MRGCFIDAAGKVLYYGLRSDKKRLESTSTFVEGLKPMPAPSVFDDNYWINDRWVLQPGVNRPSVDELKRRTISTNGEDAFKKLVFAGLFDLAKRDQPDLDLDEYLEQLWASTQA